MEDQLKILKSLEFTTADYFIGGTSMFLFSMVFIATGVLATGITTGVVTTLGFAFLLIKMRSSKVGGLIWNFLLSHPVMADLIISLVFIALMGTATATGIIAGATAAVLASALISFSGKVIGKV